MLCRKEVIEQMNERGELVILHLSKYPFNKPVQVPTNVSLPNHIIFLVNRYSISYG